MFDKILKGTENPKLKMPMLIVAIVSLLCTLVSSITYFLYYGSNSGSLFEYHFSRLTIGFPSFSSLLILLISLLPCILFILYMTVLKNKPISVFAMPTVLGLTTLNTILYLANYAHGFKFFLTVISVIALIVATVSALDGFSNRIFILVASAFGILVELIGAIIFLFDIVDYIRYDLFLYIFTTPVGILGSITLFAALLLYGLGSKTQPLMTITLNKEAISAISKK